MLEFQCVSLLNNFLNKKTIKINDIHKDLLILIKNNGRYPSSTNFIYLLYIDNYKSYNTSKKSQWFLVDKNKNIREFNNIQLYVLFKKFRRI